MGDIIDLSAFRPTIPTSNAELSPISSANTRRIEAVRDQIEQTLESISEPQTTTY